MGALETAVASTRIVNRTGVRRRPRGLGEGFRRAKGRHGAFRLQLQEGDMDRLGWSRMADLCLRLHSFSIRHTDRTSHNELHMYMLVLKEPSQDTSVEPYVGVWDGASTSLSTTIVTTCACIASGRFLHGDSRLCARAATLTPLVKHLMSFWADRRWKVDKV